MMSLHRVSFDLYILLINPASLNLDSPETILSKDDTAIPMQSDGPTQTMTTGLQAIVS